MDLIVRSEKYKLCFMKIISVKELRCQITRRYNRPQSRGTYTRQQQPSRDSRHRIDKVESDRSALSTNFILIIRDL